MRTLTSCFGRASLALAAAIVVAGATDRAPAASTGPRRGCSARESAQLDDKKERAVLKGMGWMAGALENPETLSSLGTDSVVIFQEGLMARSATVRNLARPLARYEASRLLPNLLKSPVDDRWDLFEALWMLSETPSLPIPSEDLLARVSKRLSRMPTANALYGIDVDHLDDVSEDDIFNLLIDSWILDRAALVYPQLPRPAFRLGDVLRYLFSRHYVTYDEDTSQGKALFVDHAYLATHVAFVLSDFTRLKLSPDDLGPLYGYLREQFASAFHFEDPGLVAEFVDVFRTLGFDERSDRMLCQGTRFLLQRQQADGSWGDTGADDPYDAIHPTWAVVDALRDRIFLEGTPYSYYIKSIGPFTKASSRP